MKNNFNLIRLLLAIGVILGHSYPLSGSQGDPISFLTHQYTIGQLSVYSFFCISGYLITKSFINANNLKIYLWHRFLRIYPALWVAVIVSVVLGYFGQNLYNYREFFHDPMTKDFVITNAILNDVRFFLPGSFHFNPWKDGVNGSLWTLPLEIRMYVLVGFIGILGILESKYRYNILLAVAVFLGFNYQYPIFVNLDPNSTKVCAFFILGAFWYLNDIKFNKVNLIISLIVCYLAFRGKLSLVYFLFAWSYLLLYICFVPNLFQQYFNKIGDYSYGVYIYAFPIQQYITYYLLTYKNYRVSHNQLFFLTFIVTFIFAFLSWHLLEKRCLKLKSIFDKN